MLAFLLTVFLATALVNWVKLTASVGWEVFTWRRSSSLEEVFK